MAVLLLALAPLVGGVLLGLAGYALARRAPQRLARGAQGFAALCATVLSAAFLIGVVGVGLRGFWSTPLITLSVAGVIAAILAWRDPAAHFGLAGHWLAGLWFLYSALRSLASPVSLAFAAAALLLVLTATIESAAAVARARNPDRTG